MIGITATGVIDPATGLWYVTAKTYSSKYQDGNFSPQNPPGRLNGRYWQHAVSTEDLSEAPGWPVLVDGTVFRNNPNRMFVGGNQHSRPGALLVGDYLYTGYASHCVQYNFTGAIIGFHKTTGKIIEAFATQGGPEANTVKGGGVWMSGGGLAYDGKGSMYFSTGNGYASQLKATGNSVPGRWPPTSLEEAAVNAKINADGTLTIIDFFMPQEKVALDGADRDLGTTPLQILPSDVFSCPNHRRIGVVTGKSGKTYWLNLDNLGGYQTGPNAGDAVIQIYQNENSVYAGAGVLPLSGGYVYIPVTQFKTHVFKFACDSSGNATFAKVSDSPDVNAYILGTSHGTTTSLEGEEGTGLLWISDVQGYGLRVYDPIPPSGGGPLKLLRSFNIPGVTKFSRPVFGNGRVYISTTQGYLYAFGSPVNNPLSCSTPYDFGAVYLSTTTAPLTITCRAVNQTTIQSISMADRTNFQLQSVPTLPISLFPGQKFSFTAVSSPSNVGALSSDITINVVNAVAGFSSISTVTLKASGHSTAPILAIAPNIIGFNVIAGLPSPLQTSLFWNLGDTTLTFQNISFSFTSFQGPWVTPNTTDNGQLQVGDFLFAGVSSTIQPGGSAPISVLYAPTTAGPDTVYVQGFSDGGTAGVTVVGIAGTQPKAVFEFQTPDGSGWVSYSPNTPFTFGTVYEAHTNNLLFRITNGGGSDAVPLSITVSKPPYGILGIIGKSNNVDLAEGNSVLAGQSQSANMFCSAPKSPVNVPGYNGSAEWVINTNDPNLGKQEIRFFCNAAAEQVGLLFPNGTAQYGYVGCFKENNPGRQLATVAYTDTTNNTNGKCVNACYAQGYRFAGTQYSQECWCGQAIPIQKGDNANCNYGCTGSAGQACGGNGILKDSTWISLFADSTRFDGNTTTAPLQLTQSVGNANFIGCYVDVQGKTLRRITTSSNIMTVDACAAWCGSSYAYFGLEYAQECSCDVAINPASTVTDQAQCNMPCKGSNSQYCGGPSRMQVYKVNLGSSSSSVSPPASSSTMSSSTSSVLVLSSTSSSPIPTPVSPSTLSSSSSSTSLSMTPTASPTPGSRLSDYTYIGCYIDSTTRTLNGPYVDNSSISLDTCATFCTGYTYFGTEYYSQCLCGNSLPLFKSTTNDKCTLPCVSNASQICGGSWALSIYQRTPLILGNPQQISGYTNMGCYAEKPGGRALKAVIASDSMTSELCATSALTAKFAYFGLEYGRECWIGNLLDGAVPVDASRCTMNCTGSALQNCGGAGFIQLYGSAAVVSSSLPSVSPVTSSTLTSLVTSLTSIPSTSSSSLVQVPSISSTTISVPISISLPTTFSPSFSSSSVIPSSSSSQAASSSTTVPTPIPFSTPVGSYNYVGCWTDNASLGMGRALRSVQALRSSLMTPLLCSAYCDQYAYFGVEFGNECWVSVFLSVK